MKRSPTSSTDTLVDVDSDRRRYPRQLSTSMLLTAPVPGRLLDINVAGMGIETREPLAVSSQLAFVCASGMTRLEFFGETRWCRLTEIIPLRGDSDSPVYRAGIRFVGRDRSD